MLDDPSSTAIPPSSGNSFLDLILASPEGRVPSCEGVDLRPGQPVLGEHGRSPWILFPVGATLVTRRLRLGDIREVEVDVIGRDGMLGSIEGVTATCAPARATVLVGGQALRIEATALKRSLSADPLLRDRFDRYMDCILAQFLQAAACAMRHGFEARLADRLFWMGSRSGVARLPLTQDALASMLGVGRTYVGHVLASFERRGLVAARRGWIDLVDPAGLHDVSCRCGERVEIQRRAVLWSSASKGH